MITAEKLKRRILTAIDDAEQASLDHKVPEENWRDVLADVVDDIDGRIAAIEGDGDEGDDGG